MAHGENKENTENNGAFHKSFYQGLQGGGKCWTKVDNNKHKSNKDRKNKEKQAKIGGKKRKNKEIDVNTIDKEEAKDH
eukprot:11586056-Ditylum_brightwellii.AAC.1